MRGTVFLLAILGLLVTFSLPVFQGGADAVARDRGVKFFVVEWRLTWEEGEKDYLLQLKGRTRSKNGDLGAEFALETRKTADLLEVLRTCAMGRLSGTATVGGDISSNKLVGEELTSLTCRAILK